MYFFFDDEAKNEEMVEYSEQTFESIKHYTEDGQEFWYARDLQRVLEYTEWRNFTAVIEKAKTACLNSGQIVEECLNTTRVSNFFIEIRVVSYAENLDLLGFSVFLYFHAVFVK